MRSQSKPINSSRGCRGAKLHELKLGDRMGEGCSDSRNCGGVLFGSQLPAEAAVTGCGPTTTILFSRNADQASEYTNWRLADADLVLSFHRKGPYAHGTSADDSARSVAVVYYSQLDTCQYTCVCQDGMALHTVQSRTTVTRRPQLRGAVSPLGYSDAVSVRYRRSCVAFSCIV